MKDKKTKPEESTQVGSKELYQFYKKQVGKEPAFQLSAALYRKILLDLNRMISYHITHSGLEYKLAHRLGTIKIVKKKLTIRLTPDKKVDTKGLRPDWKATKELWASDPLAKANKKLVYHLNKHTSGYYFKWYWDRRTSTVHNQFFFKFDPCRWNDRLIPKAIASGYLIDAYEK